MNPIRLFIRRIVKLTIATEAGWGYDAARHRLPASFSNVIGEPGHTNHRPRGYATAQATVVCLGALLRKLREGLPMPRKTGNLRFQLK